MTPRGRIIWALVHDERRALLADMRPLSPQQWQTPSLCTEWDIHDVLAHLIDGAKSTRGGFVRRMLAARFDFDKETAAGVARERRAAPVDTLVAFEQVITTTNTPPAPLSTRLVEVVLHGEDIRRPLGLTGHYPVPQVVDALAHQLRTGVGMGGGKETAAGWHLVTSDAGFTSGAGPAVHATALTLLLAVSGRPWTRQTWPARARRVLLPGVDVSVDDGHCAVSHPLGALGGSQSRRRESATRDEASG